MFLYLFSLKIIDVSLVSNTDTLTYNKTFVLYLITLTRTFQGKREKNTTQGTYNNKR